MATEPIAIVKTEDPNVDARVAIARIYPVGLVAKQALDRLAKSEETSQFHRNYFCSNKPVVKTEPCSDSEDQSDDGFNTCYTWIINSHEPETRLWAGHFVLSLEDLAFEGSSLGWRAGSGSGRLREQQRGVELLIVPPRSKGHHVAPQHALLRFHLKSGILMLCGIHDSHPVTYFLDDRKEPILLRKNEKYVLLNTVNRFQLGRLEFKLVFEDLDDEGYSEFLAARNKIFEMAGLEPPSPYFQAMPRSRYRHILGDIVLHDVISCGTFGMVYAAIDSRTGEPLAVKELRIKDKYVQKSKELQNEIGIATSFPVCLI